MKTPACNFYRPEHCKPTPMKTGKMKQLTSIIVFLIFIASYSNAQIAAGMMAGAVLNNTVISGDIDLKAIYKNNTVELNWKAVSQNHNIRRYQLEKSADGIGYTYVTSFAGTEKNYTVQDNNLFEGNNYYRLKLVDETGNIIYSRAELVDTKTSAASIKVLPAQFEDRIFVWIPANTIVNAAYIGSADGKFLQKAILSNSSNIVTLETGNLHKGMYLLNVQTSKGETVKLRFSKS